MILLDSRTRVHSDFIFSYRYKRIFDEHNITIYSCDTISFIALFTLSLCFLLKRSILHIIFCYFWQILFHSTQTKSMEREKLFFLIFFVIFCFCFFVMKYYDFIYFFCGFLLNFVFFYSMFNLLKMHHSIVLLRMLNWPFFFCRDHSIFNAFECKQHFIMFTEQIENVRLKQSDVIIFSAQVNAICSLSWFAQNPQTHTKRIETEQQSMQCSYLSGCDSNIERFE